MWKTALFVGSCLMVGCGGGGSVGDMATTSDLAAAAPDLSIAPVNDLGTAGDSSVVPDLKTTGNADLATNARHEDIVLEGMKPACFDLATGVSTADNPCLADLVFLVGAKVDLQSAGDNTAFCQLPGTFSQVGAVPTDYSMCMWIGYVEGGAGLANTGFILRDRASAHHFRARVVSNDLPHLIFDYAPID